MTNRRVLVADDEVHILNVVSFKLRNSGLEVLTARDGQEALELARAERPDLLIVDYQMPGLNGLEVCLKLREDPETAQVPAIMLTARGLDIEQDQLDQAGIRMVIPKPFSPREVLGSAEELLNERNVELSAEKG